MRAAVVVLLGLVLPVTGSPLPAGHIPIPNGYFTGDEFLSMPTERQGLYIQGVVDGLRVSTYLGADVQRVEALDECMQGVSDTQAAEIVRGYIRNKGFYRRFSAHMGTTKALEAFCPGFRPD